MDDGELYDLTNGISDVTNLASTHNGPADRPLAGSGAHRPWLPGEPPRCADRGTDRAGAVTVAAGQGMAAREGVAAVSELGYVLRGLGRFVRAGLAGNWQECQWIVTGKQGR